MQKLFNILLLLSIYHFSFSQNIIEAEYFIDTDNGYGNNNYINTGSAVPEGTFQFTIDYAGLSPGIHNLYVRAKDENNAWSLNARSTFYIDILDIEYEVYPDSNIIYAEYFIDNDPGHGNGVPIVISSPAKDNTISFVADLNGVSHGFHNIFIRSKDDLGRWGHNVSRTFIVEKTKIPTLKQAEYFFDTDPGYGNGNQINFQPSLDSVLIFLADLSPLMTGVHRLFVRSKNDEGTWSLISNRTIQVLDRDTSDMVRIDYFFSNDGYHSDTFSYAIPIPSPDVDLTFPAQTDQLPEDESFDINVIGIDNNHQKSITAKIPSTFNPLYCEAGFISVVNDSELSVQFTDTSFGSSLIYYWEFGDDITSIEQNPLHKYPVEGKYTVCLSVYNNETKCFSKKCTDVIVGADNTTSCFAGFSYTLNGSTVTFSSEFSNDITDYYWNFGDGTFSTNRDISHTYSKSGEYKICANVSNSISGCQNEVCKIIKVGVPDCIADFQFITDHALKKVELINLSTGNLTKIFWNLGDGTSMFKESGLKIYDNYGKYNVCLNVFDENVNCYSRKCKEVTILDTSKNFCNPKFSYVAGVGSGTIKFSENSLLGFDSWYWDFGDGGISNLKSPEHQFTRDGIYNVCLSVVSKAKNCNAQICKDVLVSSSGATGNPLTKAEFGSLVDSVDNGVLFKDFSTGNLTNWYWTFGDGTYSSEQNPPKHYYSSIGVYPVCLTVYNSSSGETSINCEDITIGANQCNIVSYFNQFVNINSLDVNFNNESKGNAEKWFWNFGDGNSSTLQNPVHNYNKPGFYLVSLSARDDAGNCFDYFARFIQVGDIDCKANFIYNVDPETNYISLSSTSKGSVDKYFWSFDDGNFGTGNSVTHQYEKPGIYVNSLTISANGGLCADFVSEPIQVGKIDCNADFSIHIDSALNTAYFTNKTIGNSTKKLWQFGDGSFSTEENPVHIFKNPGYYTVGLTNYDPTVNCMDSKEEIILIGQQGIDCEADFYYQVENFDIQFYDHSKGKDLTYYWWFGDGESSNIANPSKSYTNGGYFQVCLTVYTNKGIQNTTCKVVAVNPPENKKCLADFIYSVDENDLSVQFKDQSIGEPDGWLWLFGDKSNSALQNPQHNYTDPGFYKVRLVSGNLNNGCKSRVWQMVNVGMGNQGLKAGFGYEIDPLSLKTGGYPVDFIGVSSGKPAKYVWDFGDGAADSVNNSPTHIYNETGTYTVCLTVEDQVTEESDKSCESVNVYEVGIKDDFSHINSLSLNSYPNPFTEYTNIEYFLEFRTSLTIQLYDEEGKRISTIVNTTKDAGKHIIKWQFNDLPDGIYYIHLMTENGMSKTKLIIKN